MSKVVAFIPARCGSKSIPAKNIKMLSGQPLLYWNAEALQSCPLVDEIIVATDCDEIANVANGFGFEKLKVYRRKAANAQDQSSTESVILEYLDHAQLSSDTTFMLVQATSPLTSSQHFEEGLEYLKAKKADSLLTCVRWKRFFWSEEGESLNYDYKNRPRRQDFSGQLMENGAFYISKVSNILESKNRISGNILVYEMPEYTSVELDEPDDWVAAEKLMRKYRVLKAQDFKSIKLFISDVDGVMTDAGMYYSEFGDELKKFNTHDGMAFRLMQTQGVLTGIITSENTKMVERRAKKLQLDYLFQGKKHGGKLAAIEHICAQENIALSEVAYIGDDINCKEALEAVGFKACPADALPLIKNIPGIIHMDSKGGEGVVREFYEKFMI